MSFRAHFKAKTFPDDDRMRLSIGSKLSVLLDSHGINLGLQDSVFRVGVTDWTDSFDMASQSVYLLPGTRLSVNIFPRWHQYTLSL